MYYYYFFFAILRFGNLIKGLEFFLWRTTVYDEVGRRRFWSAVFGLAKDEFLPATMVDGKHELMEKVGSEEVGRGEGRRKKIKRRRKKVHG